MCQLDQVSSEKESLTWGRGKERLRKPSVQSCSSRHSVPKEQSHFRKAKCSLRWMKNPKFYVTRPAPLEESTQSVYFHKPTKAHLNTTEPSPALAQPWTFTLQLNLSLNPVWTEKLLLQAISQVLWD